MREVVRKSIVTETSLFRLFVCSFNTFSHHFPHILNSFYNVKAFVSPLYLHSIKRTAVSLFK